MTVAIEVEKLVKTYDNVVAVDGIDFSVQEGEVFAFLGPNGAGKTTTVEVLEGIRPRTSGEVRILGEDPWLKARDLQRRIGVIPQDFHFFPKLNPREAIDLYAGLYGIPSRAEDLLARVELADKADDMFENLSGGQKQKLGLALALVNDPQICFLDEPTTGLDPRARRSIWAVIRGLKSEGRTVFLTTHYLEEAQLLADRIAIIHLGKIIAAGRPADIIQRYGHPERLRILGDPALGDPLRRAVGLPVEVVDGGVTVELHAKGDALRILSWLDSSGYSYRSFSTAQDTLEDVFLRLVGLSDSRSLAEVPETGPA
ncbi:MAG TPA: ABC transporter ATP-binding protein [Thermoplasmata archaeon]|nr:ABC transporter ATP-binding protein [Thermoplasmata archaeon]